MSKTTNTRLFVIRIGALIGGWVLGLGAVLAAVIGGAVSIGGPNVVTVNAAAFTTPLVVLTAATAVTTGGTLAVAASWIGALVATAHLEDKTWFVLLLVLGLWSFGVIAMVAYLIAGPDDTRRIQATPGVAAASGS